jgi:hypothetical protein
VAPRGNSQSEHGAESSSWTRLRAVAAYDSGQQCLALGATRFATTRGRQGNCVTGQRGWKPGRGIVVAG